ncbi:hypothetical protein C8J57DRAFT_1470540 [Mycena rebaudengoi]|nr:hypothetical protein C8J57DRAFT_1470540 [Mycena rebaudengoi]
MRHTYSSYRGLESGNRARMQPPTHRDNLLQYTAFAADTVREIASSFEIPFLGSATTLVLEILKSVESTKSNKDICIEMVEQIHEILGVVVTLHSTSEIKGVLPIALLHDIAKFSEILQKLFTILQQQQQMGKIKQFFGQHSNAERLEACRQELNNALEMFRVRATGLTLSQLVQMRKNAKQCHEELVALLDSDSDLTSWEHFSVVSVYVSQGIGTLPDVSNSSGSFSMLPPSPKIFYGRKSELNTVVTILLQDSARISILGTGGMGKTTLAIAAVQNAQVECKYSQRYFVSCQSTPTCTELVSIIADHLGLEKQSNLSKRVVHYFTHAPPSLLVLDNFETPWEPSSSRCEVEEFISLLADIPQLALVITMRGAERPAKVKWTQPFLSPLTPLPHSAALQTFFDVADNNHEEASVNQLLELTGNLPLAVNLIASVAGAEGCDSALARWKTESTRMLSDGYDKRSSLDISIMLSFTSARMTPGAQDLLSILSMLPDGFTDADLLQAELPITDILAGKTTLLRTALVFVDKERRIQVLAPIREHVLHVHPPTNALKLKLRKHFHDLLSLWTHHRDLNAAKIVRQLSRNVGNVNSVLQDSLAAECPDLIENYQSILNLNNFYKRIQGTYSPLLLKISEQYSFGKDNPVFGDYLIQIVETAHLYAHLPVPLAEAEAKIMLGNQYFEFRHPLEQDSIGSPSRVGQRALSKIVHTMAFTGDLHGAQKHATRAQEHAEALGGIYSQAHALHAQATCQAISANYSKAQINLNKARQLLITCGLDGCTLDLQLQNIAAEIYLLKTQYLDSRNLQVSITASKFTSYDSILANLNIALIDIACGIDSGLIRKNLGQCQLHSQSLYGLTKAHLEPLTDHRFAELCLRDGDLVTANMMFTRCLALSQKSAMPMDMTTACLERLADHSTGMNNTETTSHWAGIFLALALRTGDKLATMKALRCLAQFFSVQGDDETALSLFNVALDGFTFMDVHQWRADCMVRIADIWTNCGEVLRAIGLWKAARPLFERSSQAKDVARIDAKLAAVETSILEQYERQLLQPAELNAPAEANLEETQAPTSEEEDLELVGREQKSLQIAV